MPMVNLTSGSKNLLTIAGSTGTGKTIYALVWAALKNARQGKSVVVFSDETDRKEYEDLFHNLFGSLPAFVDEFHYTCYGRLNWQYLLQHYCENYKDDLAVVIDCPSMTDAHHQIVNEMNQKGIEVCMTCQVCRPSVEQLSGGPKKVIKGSTTQSYTMEDN